MVLAFLLLFVPRAKEESSYNKELKKSFEEIDRIKGGENDIIEEELKRRKEMPPGEMRVSGDTSDRPEDFSSGRSKELVPYNLNKGEKAALEMFYKS